MYLYNTIEMRDPSPSFYPKSLFMSSIFEGEILSSFILWV